MALERTIPEMVGEGDAAVRALECEPTVRAEDEIGKSPSVEKEETLFLVLNIL